MKNLTKVIFAGLMLIGQTHFAHVHVHEQKVKANMDNLHIIEQDEEAGVEDVKFSPEEEARYSSTKMNLDGLRTIEEETEPASYDVILGSSQQVKL